MRWLLALPLVLAACSSDPVPVDSGPADTGPLHVDIGSSSDAAPNVVDVPAVPHDQGADSGAVDAADAVAVADVPAVDAVDAGADVVAVADAVALEDVVDVQLVDAAADRPDVVAVDVPRDAGPVDGGPVVYDLEAVRAGLEVRALVRESCPSGASEDCDAPPTATGCSVSGDTLRFSLHTCSTDFSGLLPLSTTAGRVVSIFAGGGGSSATTIRLASGRRIAGSPARRSFHVQIAAPVFQGEPAVSGIPGRTVDPTLGDLWLLGCPSD